jgi:oligopeptide transport system permease protein
MSARAIPEATPPRPAPDAWRTAIHSLARDRAALLGAILLAAVCLLAIFAHAAAPYAPDAQDTANVLAAPGRAHWLGTDRLGRDLLSRLIYGSRISMTVGVVVGLAGLVLGTIYGGLSGWIGGRVDNFFMRVVDVAYAFPSLLLMITMMEVFRAIPALAHGLAGILVALTIVAWVSVARLARGLVLQLREEPYVESARALGAGGGRILLRHILPNALGPLLVILTYRIPMAILSESTLSFIGLGIPPPFASWGTLAYDGWTALRSYPHLLVSPALAIFVTILAFNFVGDGLRDAMDPTLRRTP